MAPTKRTIAASLGHRGGIAEKSAPAALVAVAVAVGAAVEATYRVLIGALKDRREFGLVTDLEKLVPRQGRITLVTAFSLVFFHELRERICGKEATKIGDVDVAATTHLSFGNQTNRVAGRMKRRVRWLRNARMRWPSRDLGSCLMRRRSMRS
jgi:hypothetical protein